MTHHAGWLRYGTRALLIGIALAMITGICGLLLSSTQSDFIPLSNYVGHRLYATVADVLLTGIHRWLPWTAGAALLLAIAVRISEYGSGRVRLGLRIGLPLLALCALVFWYLQNHPAHLLGLHSIAWRLSIRIRDFLLSPYVLVLPLLMLAWVERRLRRRRLAASLPPTPEVESARQPLLFARSARCWRIVGTGGIGVLVVSYFMLALAVGLFHLQQRWALQYQPNIIVILPDTLRPDHLGCYGYDLPTSQHIDQFAQHSTRFSNVIAQSSWTLWSVESMLKSQYPDVLFKSHIPSMRQLEIELQTVAGANNQLRAYTSLAQVLHDRGYVTNAVISNPWLAGTAMNRQGYDFYDRSPVMLNARGQETASTITRIAIDRLRELGDHKFFMFLHYMDPHDPYLQHDGFVFEDSLQDVAIEPVIAHHITREQLQNRRHDLHRYNSEIAFTDHHIGKFLDALKRQGLYDDALIIFLSDHGEEFREHGATGHQRTVNQEVIQVPLIIKFPGQQEGRVVEGAFPLIDLFPSLMAYLGYSHAHLNLQGDAVDLTTIIRMQAKPIFSSTTTPAKCIIFGPQKYIFTEGASVEEYFDLSTDPLEQRNLLPNPPAPSDHVIAMFKAWDKHNALRTLSRMDADINRRRRRIVPDTSLIEHLRALGYLQ